MTWVRTRRHATLCLGMMFAAFSVSVAFTSTTHWQSVEGFAQLFLEVEVDPDSIYERDGDVWTSAGVTEGMNLTLALIEDDYGRDLALEVPRRMVFSSKRPGVAWRIRRRGLSAWRMTWASARPRRCDALFCVNSVWARGLSRALYPGSLRSGRRIGDTYRPCVRTRATRRKYSSTFVMCVTEIC